MRVAFKEESRSDFYKLLIIYQFRQYLLNLNGLQMSLRKLVKRK